MLTFTHHAVGVQQGELLMFSDFEDGGAMWTDEGPREVRRTVVFAQPFLTMPVIHAAIGMWDMARGSNQRADLQVDNITRGGFDLVFRSWGDTRVARIRANWLAIGQALHTEDWDF